MSTYMAHKETVTRKWYYRLMRRASPWARPLPPPPTCCAASTSPSTPPTLTAATLSSSSTLPRLSSPATKASRSTIATTPAGHGGLKETKYRILMQEKPEFAMQIAVKGMLPKNSLGDSALRRLRVYRGAEHKNAAQKPEVYEG